MANGKCYRHGGKTPRGDAWHVPRWPERNAPDAMAKLDRKLKELQKRAKEREKRLARRSPEALASYRAWKRSHRPGPASRRASDREWRKREHEGAVMIAAGRQPQPDVEANRAIRAQIAVLEAQLREMNLREAIEEGIGVFG